MDFIDQLKQFSARIESMQDSINTEEATKTSLIMPFFSMLGWDVFNPNEFVPEFTADVGIKKGEKVDYAILTDGHPIILIEAKNISEDLDKHGSQLFRYFGTTKAKFGILTNGICYRLFTDLDEPNKMDEKAFLEFNLSDIRDNQVPEIKKFCKANFNIDEILSTASDLKYSYEFKNIFSRELQSPSDEFVKFFLKDAYSGRQTQAVVEKFTPIVKRALNTYISELMNNKIKSALNSDQALPENITTTADNEPDVPQEKEHKIVTTNEELEAYFIVKNILKEAVPMEDITFKDTETYFGVLYKGNSRCWICRLKLNGDKKYLILPDENKKEIRMPIFSIYDLEQHNDELLGVLNRYI